MRSRIFYRILPIKRNGILRIRFYLRKVILLRCSFFLVHTFPICYGGTDGKVTRVFSYMPFSSKGNAKLSHFSPER